MAENRGAFLRSLKKKGSKKESVAKVRADNLDKATPLESNKSLAEYSDESTHRDLRRVQAAS